MGPPTLKRQNTVEITQDTPNCPSELIAEVRRLVLQEVEKDPSKYEEEDVRRFKESDWLVTRYILRKKGDVKAAAEMVINTAKWRKELQMIHWKDTDFPELMYKSGSMFPYARDKRGNTCIYIRCKFHQRINKFIDLEKKFILHVVNRVDKEIDGRGLMIVWDMGGAGLANADFDMLWFLVSALINYNPKWLNYILVYDLPWILRGAWKVAQTMVPEDQRKLIRLCNGKDIHEYIDPENLPDYIPGGTCTINYRKAPKGCKSFEEVGKEYGMTKEDIDKVLKIYEPLMKEDEAKAAKANPRRLMRRQSSLSQLWHFLRHPHMPNMPATFVRRNSRVESDENKQPQVPPTVPETVPEQIASA